MLTHCQNKKKKEEKEKEEEEEEEREKKEGERKKPDSALPGSPTSNAVMNRHVRDENRQS